jgi:hypothetical protein
MGEITRCSRRGLTGVVGVTVIIAILGVFMVFIIILTYIILNIQFFLLTKYYIHIIIIWIQNFNVKLI